MFRGLLFCMLSLIILPATVMAAPVSFTRTFQADFEFSFLPGPLNPNPVPTPFIPFRAIGDLTIELDGSINDAGMPTSVPIVNATGTLTGIPPSPAFTLPHTISPDVEFLGGDLLNIVRNAGGDVISADISNLSMRWEMIAPNLAPGGLRIYSQAGLPFHASGVAIPFERGTVLAGAAKFDVFLDLGDPTNDPLVVIGRNRTLSVVPEPSSLVLAFACVGAWVGMGRRRRKKASGHSISTGSARGDILPD